MSTVQPAAPGTTRTRPGPARGRVYIGPIVALKFAKAFRRHVDCPDREVPATNVREALAAYFRENPAVRSYVVDESFALRRHVAVFVNDRQVVDRRALSDEVADGDEVYVFQALSGGSA